MYLVPAEDKRPSPALRVHQRPLPWKRWHTKQHPHTELIKLRTKHCEAELPRNAWTKEVADYIKQIVPSATNPPSSTAYMQFPKPKAKSRRRTRTDVTAASVATDTNIRPPKVIILEKPKREIVREKNDDD